MTDLVRFTKWLLLFLTVLHLGTVVNTTLVRLQGADGLVYEVQGSPIGGDFINAFSAARMVIEGRSTEIYDPDAFMAYQRSIIPHDIGWRLWAYPPHSLLGVWPLGAMGYWLSLFGWTILGLAVLVLGARRVGFGWIETTIIALSPAALSSVTLGQTGNLAAGLLLLALPGTRSGTQGVVSAALLTMKPQAGFLLPLLWAVEQRWKAVLVAGTLTVGLILGSLWLFGSDAWHTYLGSTLTRLNTLESEGTGPFLAMIPSTFIAMRILADDPVLAGYAQALVAVVVLAITLWQLRRLEDPRGRWALLLTAMALITPYIHVYDLAPIMAAGLMLLVRSRHASRTMQAFAGLAAVVAWSVPLITRFGNSADLPVAPLALALIFALCTLSPAPPPFHQEKSQS